MTFNDFDLIFNFIQNQDLLQSKSQFWHSLFNFSSALTSIRPFLNIRRLLRYTLISIRKDKGLPCSDVSTIIKFRGVTLLRWILLQQAILVLLIGQYVKPITIHTPILDRNVTKCHCYLCFRSPCFTLH